MLYYSCEVIMKQIILIAIFAVLMMGVLNGASMVPASNFGNIPLYFVANHGQADAAVAYYARTPGYTLWVTHNGVKLGDTHLVFLDANKHPGIDALGQTSHTVNFFRGKDTTQWKTGVPTSKAVLYKELYKNIDLKIYGKQKQVEYDWIVKSGGDPKQIKFSYRNISNIFIGPGGDLVMDTASGRFTHRKPYSYQTIAGKRVEVASAFRQIDKTTFGITVGAYNKKHTLVIDPFVEYYATWFGGSGAESSTGIAIDSSGCAYIAGTTESSDFTAQKGYDTTLGGDEDAFVVKVSATGDALVYSTYLGGSDLEGDVYIAVDTMGSAYITGDTWSSDFPTRGAFQSSHAGGKRDGFITKLSPTGDSLVYSTYLGGTARDSLNSIAVDSSGSAYIAGYTNSFDFPTQNPYQAKFAGGYDDAIVTKLSPTGDSLVYSTYLGGSDVGGSYIGDMAFGVAVDSSGCAYVTGLTYSIDFPILNPYQSSINGVINCFVTKFSSTGNSLVYSTYVGGSSLDFAHAIAVDSSGCAHVPGLTYSKDFPLKNAYLSTFTGYGVGFAFKLSADGSSLVYSTLVGGDYGGYAGAVAIDGSGSAYVSGSADYLVDSVETTFPLLVKLSDTGAALINSTAIPHAGSAMTVDSEGRVYLTSSETQNSNQDIVVSKILFTDSQTYALNVRSTGIAAVDIDVSPNDFLGESSAAADFSRVYTSGVTVTLTAPANHNLANFLRWELDGIDQSASGTTLQVAMNAGHSAVAVYEAPATIALDRNLLTFASVKGTATVTSPQYVTLTNTGDASMDWSLTTSSVWIRCTPTYGTDNAVIEVSVDPSLYAAGPGEIRIISAQAANSPQVITVYHYPKSPGTSDAPFGIFATPTDGSTVSSSVPFTGWVLDDIEVESVKIYNGDSYIGDATFVDGARPDVEQAYPNYPLNYTAGWGYMMLTNYLPNGGNGSYTFKAVATDKEGNTTVLGTKTVTVDNANAVKPFGAIDTPWQGGPASGDEFINWGWALTPQPNSIPTDGSTIYVWVNGVQVGQPTYNIYREDIAKYFPGYANSNGAVGYFYLDTTAYENGLHTIQWTVTDSAGNTDGIGSRFFTIYNGSGNRTQAVDASALPSSLHRLPLERDPVSIKGRELERIQFHVPGVRAGYLQVGNRFKRLPIGATLDTETGRFSWSTGPGHVGRYRLLFIKKGTDGKLRKYPVTVTIAARY